MLWSFRLPSSIQVLAVYAPAFVDTSLTWPEASSLRLDMLSSVYDHVYAALLSCILHQVCHSIVDLVRLQDETTALSVLAQMCV